MNLTGNRTPKWIRIHLSLAKIALILCFVGAMVMAGYFTFFREHDGEYGKYYVYRFRNDGKVQKAPVFWRDRDCRLVLLYDSISENTDVLSTHSFRMDTLSIDINQPVDLINFECDSLVGVIRFRNSHYDLTMSTSKAINPVFHEGMVNPTYLHKEQEP